VYDQCGLRMTSVEQWRSALASSETQVSIAGVPWPAYKLIALALGLLVLLVVGITTGSAAPAVLSAAGVSTVAWIVLGSISRLN